MPQVPANLGSGQMGGSVKDRMAAAAANAPERLMIILDNSISMGSSFMVAHGKSMGSGKSKMEGAKDVIDTFLQKCDKNYSAVGLIKFSSHASLVIEPVRFYPKITFAAQHIHPEGSTNLGMGIQMALDNSITRAIIISDGETSDEEMCVMLANQCAEKKIPLDCVFIGDTTEYSGEMGGVALLKKLAEITNGFFFYVNDFAKFEKAVVQLEAKNRLMLTHEK